MPAAGCYKGKYIRKGNPLYASWGGMLRRCTNPKHKDFDYYGGRGVQVCERWQDFDTFVDDMQAGYAAGLTLDRKDNSIGYSPDNCEWTTRKAQANNRRSNVFYANPITGESKQVTDWCDELGLPYSTARSRITVLKMTKFEDIFAPYKGRWPK